MINPSNDETAADRVLRGWVVVRQPDGTLLMRETTKRRWISGGGCLVFTVLWNAFLALDIAVALGVAPGNWEGEGHGLHRSHLWSMVPFYVVGVLGIWIVVCSFGTRQEWIAGPNFLELRWGWTFLRRKKSRRYTDGKLELSHNPHDESGPASMLSFRCPGGWMKQGAITGSERGEDSLQSVREFAELVAQTTGWPLELKVDDSPADPAKPAG